MFDDQDLALVTALQIHPLASWTDLAPILGQSAPTLARRWQTLSAQGLAWVTLSHVRNSVTLSPQAFIQVQCERGRLRDVANAVREDAPAQTVHLMTGTYDILMLMSMDIADIEGYLVDRIGRIDGIRSYRVLPCTQLLFHGGMWQADGLSPGQAQAVAALAPGPAPEKSGPGRETNLSSPLSTAILELLYLDGRMSTTQVWKHLTEAENFEVSLSSVRRQIAAMFRTDRLALRCDVSATHVGWPVAATLWCRLPVDQMDGFAALLRDTRSGPESFPEIRSALLIAGEANVHLTLWLRSVSHLHQVEARLARLQPSLQVADRSINFSTPKRFGAILEEGRRVRTVPVRMAG
ncbi:Lrp/AsnC family transcriptional regulator [Mycetocola spongiae]|uniref:Lrp/AsnC family transcriptional regulator n=1 Tax=Mycetocola spongiae TaxID=2859226 RepID=UPI001CF1B39E|nr:Lrp/AsnC family transcriptional regulator [Mycetocola spongiae]UCR88069.1 Lrp/AsnC family transcriptional regulator [Mycetocola spongiae]